jgi:GT2 family glycosyltransferase
VTIPVIVLNWNGATDTIECVNAVLTQTCADFLLYLVDNGSGEMDVKTLREAFGNHPKIRLILNEVNYGFTRGCNHVLADILQNENPEYIALLNNDATPEPQWLERLVERARRHEAGMVSSRMINYYDRSRMDNAGHFMLNTAEILPAGHGEPVEHYGSPFENMGACAGAALYSTAMLRDIGLFDEYFDTGYEDAELGLRAGILGYKTIYEPSAIVYHKVSRSVSRIRDLKYLTKIQTNIFYTYLKLMPASVILINLPFIGVKYLCVVVFDLAFWRGRFLRMFIEAFYAVLFRDRALTLKNRRRFLSRQRPISAIRLIRKQTFFLRHDLKRLFKYLIDRKGNLF